MPGLPRCFGYRFATAGWGLRPPGRAPEIRGNLQAVRQAGQTDGEFEPSTYGPGRGPVRAARPGAGPGAAAAAGPVPGIIGPAGQALRGLRGA